MTLLAAQAQDRGLPPRATAAEYQAHAQAGTYTIAAEFAGHGVPTPNGVFSTEEYVTVEVAVFGPRDSKLQLAFSDFSLRINGKKAATPASQFGAIFKSLKDPEWVPPVPAETKSKSSFGTGGGSQSDGPPAPVHVPIAVERAMEQKVQKASLPEGERPLPDAGLIFFEYRGKESNIRSMVLLYTGPAGKASVTLQ